MDSLNWIIGCVLSVLSTFIGAFSKLLIRKSWKVLPPKETGSPLENNTRKSNQELVRKSRVLHFFGMVGMGVLNPVCECTFILR